MEQLKKQIVGTAPTPEDLRSYGKTIAMATDRIAGMIEVLSANGFRVTAKKDYIYADSETVEAAAARRLLAEHGFADREYQIYLEYRRQWGVM
ncbi:hypothetical protein M7775_01875 [Sporomusa sphaeroides DSM 2875]|nr:hypothetical protein [Sporomusa sphaeroides]MCM0757315.1 hypothetical protein [Sporomusa sphaeroides DSM 2875]